MRNRWTTLALMMTALVLPACQAALAPGAEVVLTVILADDWAGTGPVIDVVRSFEAAHPGVRVDVDGLPFSSIADAVETSLRAGTPPDLAQWHAFAAGARGIAEPLDDLWADHLVDEDFLDGAVEDVEWAGVRYGVPLDTNALVLLVNADQLVDAGLSLDGFGSFDELIEGAASLGAPFGPSRAFAHSASSWAAYGWIRANGGELVTIDAQGTPTFHLDDPRTVEALAFLGDTVNAGLAHAPGLRNRSAGMLELFLSGEASIIASGSWDLVAANAAGGGEGQSMPRVVAMPLPPAVDGSSGTVMGGSSLFVPTGSLNRELAFAFATALIEPGPALALAAQEGRLPVRRAVLADPAFDDPTLAVVRRALEVAAPMKLIAYPGAQEAFSLALEEILAGERPAPEALRVAQLTARAWWGAQ